MHFSQKNLIDVAIILSNLKAQLNSKNIQIRKNTKIIIILRKHFGVLGISFLTKLQKKLLASVSSKHQ